VTTISSKGIVITGQTNGIIDVGRAASWAVCFEKLLRDAIGIRIFTVSLYIFIVDDFYPESMSNVSR
jgi:hypothetical protein